MDKKCDFASFFKYARIENWESGELICYWTPDTGIYYIISGIIHITRILPSGSHRIIHILGKDNFFFENRYFYAATRATAAYVATAAQTACFSAANVEELLSSSPNFCRALIMNMARKNLTIGEKLVNSAHICAETHMLSILYDLARIQNDIPVNTIRITQAKLSDIVGKHPVNVNIILKKLECAGYIKLRRGAIELKLDSIESALASQYS